MLMKYLGLFPVTAQNYTCLYLNECTGADTIRRQAVLCHRVLRTLQQVAQTSTVMSHETWEALLIFMLAINETLLAIPTIKGIYIYKK